jgi:signal peptidase I
LLKKPQANAMWAELLAKSGREWLPVLTGSMSPLIRPGDQVLVAVTDVGSISTGDIMAFWYGDNIVVHRILKKQKTDGDTCFKEKGDATYYSKFIHADKIIGRVTALKKGDKTFLFNSSGSRLVTAIFGLWLFMTTAIVSMFRSSTHKIIRKGGSYLSRLFLLISSVLVRIGSIVWFLYGISASRNTKLGQEQAQPQAN